MEQWAKNLDAKCTFRILKGISIELPRDFLVEIKEPYLIDKAERMMLVALYTGLSEESIEKIKRLLWDRKGVNLSVFPNLKCQMEVRFTKDMA